MENVSDFDLSAWLSESRPVHLKEWLANHTSENIEEWVKTHRSSYSLASYLKAHPSFNLSGWLDEQGSVNTEEWLQKSLSDANETGGSEWHKLSPNDEIAKVTGPGFCCCGISCEKASKDCCGPWFPSFKGVKGSKLSQVMRSTLNAAKKQRFIQLAAEVRKLFFPQRLLDPAISTASCIFLVVLCILSQT